jgi:hypothetical protein
MPYLLPMNGLVYILGRSNLHTFVTSLSNHSLLLLASFSVVSTQYNDLPMAMAWSLLAKSLSN